MVSLRGGLRVVCQRHDQRAKNGQGVSLDMMTPAGLRRFKRAFENLSAHYGFGPLGRYCSPTYRTIQMIRAAFPGSYDYVALPEFGFGHLGKSDADLTRDWIAADDEDLARLGITRSTIRAAHYLKTRVADDARKMRLQFRAGLTVVAERIFSGNAAFMNGEEPSVDIYVATHSQNPEFQAPILEEMPILGLSDAVELEVSVKYAEGGWDAKVVDVTYLPCLETSEETTAFEAQAQILDPSRA